MDAMSPAGRVRPMEPPDLPAVLERMARLWPDFSPPASPPGSIRDGDFGDEQIVVWVDADDHVRGFASFSLRPWAEGCRSTPCPYVEGWWVDPELRRAGVGRQLFAAVEAWARARGFTEIASDVEVDNDTSLAAHAALGYEPTLRVQFFRKAL